MQLPPLQLNQYLTFLWHFPGAKIDIYLPDNRTIKSTTVIIMIHGGGWYSGDKADLSQYTDTMRKRLPDYAVLISITG